MKNLGIFVTIAFMLFSSNLYGQREEGRGLKEQISKLKLTDEQKKDVDKIHLDMEKQMIAQKAKNETAEVELRQLFKADNPDKTAIEKKINDIADLQVQMRMIRINSWFEVNKLLTPEQQKTWKKALKDFHAMPMHGKMMEHHKMGKGPMNEHQESPPSK